MKYKLGFIFRHSPFGTSQSREGLDALLAATAFCDENEIAVFFMDDGVFNLVKNQQAEIILQKDFVKTFKLLDLYDIEHRFICQQSLTIRQLDNQPLIINCQKQHRTLLMNEMQKVEKLLTF